MKCFALAAVRRSLPLALPAVLLLAALAGDQNHRCLAGEPEGPFPHAGLLPKTEVQALSYLQEHPLYDGRGVIVAIFDTGVDPGAEGMQQTPDGRPKMIDVIDGTGSGDVDMTTLRTVQNGAVTGLTGRQLKLDPQWVAENEQVHIGWKRGYDFFPSALISRLKKDRQETFARRHREIEFQLRTQLANAAAKPVDKKKGDKQAQGEKPPAVDKKELTARLEQLRQSEQLVKDPGPIFDCITFRQGDRWRAVVDTDQDGDLTDEVALASFGQERKYGQFAEGDLHFAVQIYESGELLSLVVDCGEHGTHVAGIVAGCYPDHPELNGLAPGAQILSVKIGDPRMGSMETGPAIERGLLAVLRYQADIINMSYGEPTLGPDEGRLVERIASAVDDRGVLFIAAAGNDGPALSTVIAPGGTTSTVLGVGAYLSPEMKAAEYATRDTGQETTYHWSSRGPTLDGALGVDILAPGGAIAGIPRWARSRNMQMNGTSMASPSASGSAALLLSGLKQAEIPYSPASVRRALQNTARPIAGSDPFSQGPGLLQIERAFAFLEENSAAAGELLRFLIEVGGKQGTRGVYLREKTDTAAVVAHSIEVKPIFPRSTGAPERQSLDMRFRLRPTADWVRCGEFLAMNSSGRRFEALIDPTALAPGAHYAEIEGIDTAHPERGPVFRVPVTAIITESPPSLEKPARLEFSPGGVSRHFLSPPAGANRLEIVLHLAESATPQSYQLHCVQADDARMGADANQAQSVRLQPGETKRLQLPILPEKTLEVCLAQNWNSLGDSALEWSVQFGGVASSTGTVLLTPGGVARLDTIAGPHRESLKPQAALTHRRYWLAPQKHTIRPLVAELDRAPGEDPVYELQLEYALKLAKKASLTVRLPANDRLFYASPWVGYLSHISNKAGRLLATDDFRPEEVTLKPGDYVVRFTLRHADPHQLAKLASTPAQVDQKLDQPLTLTAYGSLPDAVAGQHPFSSESLAPHEQATLYLVAPAADKLPAELQPGELLTGGVKLSTVQAKGADPEVALQVAAAVSKPAAPAAKAGSSSKERAASLLELRLDQLRALPADADQEFERLQKRLLRKHPHSLELLQVGLHRLDGVKVRKQQLPQVVAAADRLLTEIDTDQLARTLGQRKEADTAAYDLAVKQRKFLVDALYRKGRALGYMELPDVVALHPIADQAALDKAFAGNFSELQRWVDPTETDYFLLHIRQQRRQGHTGQALALLQRRMPTAPSNYWYHKKRRDLFIDLGWDHLAAYEAAWLLIEYPHGQ
ncbi:S8 family serine peptidase [Lignipirellula cremea]|uniref:tripeptidyl-peptidase II n=1 Tax=Lignipirellula cremea TaxID=2528010 RepID=A0A518E3R7_9BACT|nr:S8 family serine peptidase [Lignipirellula cremea]QDU98736.1 Serine protease AprX [Lignipirellula cremea]